VKFHWRPADVQDMTVRQLLFLLGPPPRSRPPIETAIDGIPVEQDR
jgi:hypothetical protein